MEAEVGDKPEFMIPELEQLEKKPDSVSLSSMHLTHEKCKIICEYLRHDETVRRIVFSGCGVDYECCKYISELLKVNSNITDLFLTGNSIYGGGFNLIAEGLKHNKSVKTLGMNKNKFLGVDCEAFGGALKENSSLEFLGLGSCGIDDVQIKAICESIKSPASGIKFLTLDYNEITPIGLEMLSKSLGKNTTLKKLFLNGNPKTKPINGISQKNFFANLQCRSLLSLSMGECGIVDDDCKEIGEFLLRPDCALEILSLSSNEIGDLGAQYLGKALSKNKTLTELNLSANRLGDKGCADICEGLKTNETLSHLNMYYNQIGHDGGISLAAAVSSPGCGLEDINISNNSICAGMGNLLESAVQSKKIMKFKIQQTGASLESLKKFGNLAEMDSALNEMWIENEIIDNDVANALAAALRKTKRIKTVVLSFCEMSSDSIECVVKSLIHNATVEFFHLNEDESLDMKKANKLIPKLICKNQTLKAIMINFRDFEPTGNLVSVLENAMKFNFSLDYFFFGGEMGMRYLKRNMTLRDGQYVLDETFVGHDLGCQHVFTDVVVQFDEKL